MMPGPQARAITRQHRRELGLLTAVVTRRTTTLARTADPADIDAWWQQTGGRAEELTAAAAGSASQLGARYLVAHAAAEGVRLAATPALPGPQVIATALRVAAVVAFKLHQARTGDVEASLRTMATTLSGTAVRLTLNGQRDTVMATFAQREQIAGWQRVGGTRPCAFCAMLIGRGAVYSKTTVDFQAHDHDHCTPEPLYRRERDPPEVRRLAQQWEQVTAGASGKQALAAWRHHWDAQQQ
jgi:hypothetical protein